MYLINLSYLNTKVEKVRELCIFISPAPALPSLSGMQFQKHWRGGGMTNCPGLPPSIPLRLYFFPSTSYCLSFLYPLAPFPMPSYVLWIHLPIKQIYHSVMEAGKGGRLWNALALRAGKGCVHSAMLPRSFPAAPALAPSAQSVFMIHALPQQPPSIIHSCPTCTNQTHPSHQTAHNCNNTVPGLTRNPPLGINLQPGLLDWLPALVSSYTE